MPFSHKCSGILGVFWIALLAAPVSAQQAEGEVPDPRPNVFFDCDGRDCNSEYYRTEITWVNWVRDREVADVHIIMTSLRTASGGQEYQIDMIGYREFDGYEDSSLFQALSTDTDRERLDGITHALGLSLGRFASESGFRGIVTLQGPDNPTQGGPGANRMVSQEEVDDPWNLWFFRFNGSGNLDGEETRSSLRLNSTLSATRVTPTWRMVFFNYMSSNKVEVELNDGTFSDQRTDWNSSQLIAYALSDHWSIGAQNSASRSTRSNQNFRIGITPAIEYSFFPYDEATRRSLTVFYKIGPAYRDYIEETVFGEMSETRWEQSLEIELSQRQPWGDAGISLSGSHYLHDIKRHNVSMSGNIDFRIVRGFSVNARGDITWVDDQIYLSAGGVTDEEALLRLRTRATDFNYGLTLGFSIQFGTIYNNVVNNRFRAASSGGPPSWVRGR